MAQSVRDPLERERGGVEVSALREKDKKQIFSVLHVLQDIAASEDVARFRLRAKAINGDQRRLNSSDVTPDGSPQNGLTGVCKQKRK